MGSAELTEWWLDESSLPDVIWARLRLRADGSAEVFDCDGRTVTFSSGMEAANSLLEDEYVRLRSVDPDVLSSFGLSERELVPPVDSGGALVLSDMCRRIDAAEAIRDIAAVTWPRPWTTVTSAEREVIGQELRRELHPEHPLHGRAARAFLRRIDRDDVLFIMSHPVQLALVHLTYSNSPPDQPPWPTTELYEHVSQFVDRTHKDAAEYEAG
jgi:hypothetical protein